MANTPANITEHGVNLSENFKDTLNRNLTNLKQKDVDNYNELKSFSNSNSGKIEDLRKELVNQSFTGSEHDALVTAALIDSEDEDFGPEGTQTYLDGRLNKWEQRIKDIESDVNTPDMTVPLTNYAPMVPIGSGTNDQGNYINQNADVEYGPLNVSAYGNTYNSIVKNGNFTDGSDWTPYNGTESIVNNTYSLTGNGSGSEVLSYQNTETAVVIGNEIFVKCYVRVTNSDCTAIVLKLDGTTAGTTVTLDTQTSPVSGTWYELSGIGTIGADFTGNIQILIQHNYSSAATANGKVLQIQTVVGIDLSAEGLENLTENLCIERFPYWTDGVNSTLPVKVKSININLTNFTKWEVGGIEPNGVKNSNVFYRRSPYESVKAGNNITLSNASYTAYVGLYFYDEAKNFISRSYTLSTTSRVTIVPLNARYARGLINTNGTDLTEYDKVQIEYNSTATPYVKHEFSESYVSVPFNDGQLTRVPNGSTDEVDFNTGIATQRNKKYALQSGDITSLSTSPTNVDYITISKPLDFYGYNKTDSSQYGSLTIEGYSELQSTESLDNTDYENYFKLVTSGTLVYLAVPKGTYEDLAAAQSALAGTTIIYQLSQSIERKNAVIGGPLNGFKKGTIIIEPYHRKTITYDSGSGGLVFDYPILPIDKIKRTVDGQVVEMSFTATFASDMKSATITELTDGDVVEVYAPYDPAYSTIPKTVHSACLNTKSSLAATNAAVNSIAKTLIDIQDQLDILIVMSI